MLRAWSYLMRAQLAHAEAELPRAGRGAARPTTGCGTRSGRSLERQSRLAEALPHLRLAAAMSGDPEHELAVLRVERLLAESGEKPFDDLS